jgi:hypothetical protein
MPSSFNPAACLQALANLPVVKAQPIMKEILAAPRLVKLISDIPDILGSWSLHEEALDADNFWSARLAWFTSERVRVDITSAVTSAARLDSHATAVSTLFKEMHAKEAEAAKEQLARVGARLICSAAAVSDSPVNPDLSLLREGQIAVVMDMLNAELADSLMADGLSVEQIQKIKDGELTLAELLNSAPQTLLLSLRRKEVPPPVKAKKKTKRSKR